MDDTSEPKIPTAAEVALHQPLEVVYFRRTPFGADDKLTVPAGTAHLHVRAELITRIVPVPPRRRPPDQS